MNKYIVRFTAPILAVLVLLSTLPWSVEKHLCMGRIIDIAFFHHAESCGMQQAITTFGKSKSDNHCCDNESFTLKGQDELKISCDEFENLPLPFLVTPLCTFSDLILVDSENAVPNEIYPPPLLVRDLNLLHEVFLI